MGSQPEAILPLREHLAASGDILISTAEERGENEKGKKEREGKGKGEQGFASCVEARDAANCPTEQPHNNGALARIVLKRSRLWGIFFQALVLLLYFAPLPLTPQISPISLYNIPAAE
jgi:hypothetical protein